MGQMRGLRSSVPAAGSGSRRFARNADGHAVLGSVGPLANLAQRHPSLPLIVVMALTCSCVAGGIATPVGVPDPCFAGTFWDEDAFLRVDHYEDGILSAVGSAPAASGWEVLQYLGVVTEPGVAIGEASIWLLRNGVQERLDFTLELRLDEGADCEERNVLSYSFHFVLLDDSSFIRGSFAGRRGDA